jgi:hypothetical protein
VDERATRQAKNEALHREVNERLAEMDKQADAAWADEEQRFEFICECGRGGCDARVSMALVEYEDVRGQDDRFAVHPGHENDEIESVVKRGDSFVVVDKIAALEPYVEDDPRGAPPD